MDTRGEGGSGWHGQFPARLPDAPSQALGWYLSLPGLPLGPVSFLGHIQWRKREDAVQAALHQLHLLSLAQGGLQDAARQVKAEVADSGGGGKQLIQRSPLPKHSLSQGCRQSGREEPQGRAAIRGGPYGDGVGKVIGGEVLPPSFPPWASPGAALGRSRERIHQVHAGGHGSLADGRAQRIRGLGFDEVLRRRRRSEDPPSSPPIPKEDSPPSWLGGLS